MLYSFSAIRKTETWAIILVWVGQKLAVSISTKPPTGGQKCQQEKDFKPCFYTWKFLYFLRNGGTNRMEEYPSTVDYQQIQMVKYYIAWS